MSKELREFSFAVALDPLKSYKLEIVLQDALRGLVIIIDVITIIFLLLLLLLLVITIIVKWGWNSNVSRILTCKPCHDRRRTQIYL